MSCAKELVRDFKENGVDRLLALSVVGRCRVPRESLLVFENSGNQVNTISPRCASGVSAVHR